ALVKTGDEITIDAETAELTLHVKKKELKVRREKLKLPKVRVKTGVLAKYASTVTTASEGALTDKVLPPPNRLR
ncbi:MAG: dihydroxy-acid dehydratase, partial [Kiritimatiellia bacterium]